MRKLSVAISKTFSRTTLSVPISLLRDYLSMFWAHLTRPMWVLFSFSSWSCQHSACLCPRLGVSLPSLPSSSSRSPVSLGCRTLRSGKLLTGLRNLASPGYCQAHSRAYVGLQQCQTASCLSLIAWAALPLSTKCGQNFASHIRMFWRQVFPVLATIHRRMHSIPWALYLGFLASGKNRTAWCYQRTLLATKEHQKSFVKWFPIPVGTCASIALIFYHLQTATASNCHHRISIHLMGLRHLFLGSAQQYLECFKFQSKYLWQSNYIPSFCIQYNLRDLSFSSQFSQGYHSLLTQG